jgi:hypothetical protein
MMSVIGNGVADEKIKIWVPKRYGGSMKYVIGIVLLIVLLTLPVQARAEFTGLDLLHGCAAVIKHSDGRALTPIEDWDMAYWMGFLTGFLDGYAITSYNVEKRPLCLPSEGVKGEQIARIVHKYLENHPEDLHNTPRILVFRAVLQAFPCKQ